LLRTPQENAEKLLRKYAGTSNMLSHHDQRYTFYCHSVAILVENMLRGDRGVARYDDSRTVR
jgi:hypothetical protein